MNDELFNIPQSDHPDAKLAAARKKYAEACQAADEAPEGQDARLAREQMAARVALETAERIAMMHARGIVDKRTY